MTIISDRLGIIHLHQRKTAGTSLEFVLARYCGPDDVITPEFESIKKDLGSRSAQNFEAPGFDFHIREDSLKRIALNGREVLRRLSRGRFFSNIEEMHEFYSIAFHRRNRFFRHTPASKIVSEIGEERWNDLFKIAILRDPLEQFISQYKYRKGRPILADLSSENASYAGCFLEFEKFSEVCSSRFFEMEEDRILLDKKVCLNAYLDFSKLTQDFRYLGYLLGLKEDIGAALEGVRLRRSQGIKVEVTTRARDQILSASARYAKYIHDSTHIGSIESI